MPGRTRFALFALRLSGLAALALAGITCRDANPVGPGLPSQAAFAVAPRLQRATGEQGLGFLSLERVRGTLTPIGGGTPYSVESSFLHDTATLSFDVAFPGPTQRYTLAIAAFDTAGDTLFRSQREVTTRAGDNAPVSDTLQYVAPDTALRFLSLSLADTVLLGGDSLHIIAQGYDARERPVVPLRLGWTSRDTALARVVARSSSATLLGGALENDVWIVARAFNGTVDSLLVPVRLKVANVLLGSDTVRLPAGTFVQLGATVVDPSGAALPNRDVSWTSLDSSIAVASPLSLFPRVVARTNAVALTNLASIEGIGVGVTRIVASTGGRADTSVVIVSPPPVATVLVTPDTLVLLAPAQARLFAETRDARNNVLNGRAITWSSADPLIVRVDADGVVSGIAPGLVTVTATSEGIVGTASVRVDTTRTAVARTVVSPATVALHAIGQTTQLVARSYAADSSLTGGRYSWRVNTPAPGIAAVDSLGRLTALGAGSAYVVAMEAGGTSDSAAVDITQVAATVLVAPPATLGALGLTATFHATAADSLGNAIVGRTFSWTVDPQGIGSLVTVGADSAVVQSVAYGAANIVASTDGVSGAARLSVNRVATSIVASPASLRFGIDGRAQVNAVVYDGNGAPMSVKPGDLQWGVDGSGGIVEVDATGEVHARTTGTAGVFAALKGLRSKTVSVDISDANPLTLSFSTDTMTLGDSARVSVFLSAGRTVPVTVVLADSASLLRFGLDTLIIDAGRARYDFMVYGSGQGTTVITATDPGKVFAPATLSVTLGKTVTPPTLAPRSRVIGATR